MSKKSKSWDSENVKYFDDQFEDEDVKLVFRKHVISMRKGLIWGSIGLLVGPLITLILTYSNLDNPPTMTFFYLSFVGSILLSMLLFFPSWISWYFSLFIMTDKRFIQITQKGFFHRNVSDLNLNLIQSINYDIDGVEQTLLSYGTIIMQTYVGDLYLKQIHNPARTQRRLVDVMKDVGVKPLTNPINTRVLNHHEEETED